jgi:hypothetical protein
MNSLTTQQRVIFECMKKYGTTYDVIQEKTGYPRSSIRRVCAELKTLGLVVKGSHNGLWRVKTSPDSEYPEVLKPEQFDRVAWKQYAQFGLDDNRSIQSILTDVYRHAKKINGVIYTQVDSGNGIQYVRGIAKVNRTGIFEVVSRERKS